ncbi:LamG domain-containing protein, partial [Amycolatopsis bartoniae]
MFAAGRRVSRTRIRTQHAGFAGRRRHRFSAGHFLAIFALLAGLTAALAPQADATPLNPSGTGRLEASGQPAPAPATPSTSPNPSATASPAQETAMDAAAATARSSGKSTPVDALTTETQQVTADAKGGFTLTENLGPVRTRQQGKWVPLDLTLHPNGNGTFSPTATAYGTVTFSGGGTTPLATTTSGGTTFSVSWPSPLPSPTVRGDQATYPAVYPGVDLVVNANAAGGFSDVLVVHDAAAAKNPALAHLTLPVDVRGGRLASTTAGGLRLTPQNPGRSLIGETPAVWDSNQALPSAPVAPNAKPSTPVAADPSDVHHAGLVAHTSPMPIRLTTSEVGLTPDPKVLNGPNTVYPVYIDPSVQWQDTAGAGLGYAEVKQGGVCHGTSFYNGASTDGEPMGVGYNGWPSTPLCIGIERTYYQWQLPTGLLAGAVINQATVTTAKEYSSSCVTTRDYLHLAGALPTVNGAPYVSWDNQQGPGPVVGFVDFGPAFNPDYCSTAPRAVYGGFDVTGWIDPRWPTATFSLTGDESLNRDNFARFAPSVDSVNIIQPALDIKFNRPPNTPLPVKAFSGSNNVGCNTNPTGPYPYMGKTMVNNAPALVANISDPDNNVVQAKFQYWVSGSSTMNTASSPDLSSGSNAMVSLSQSFVSGLSNGQVVNWNVSTFDGQLWSPWSATCHFTAEPTAPTEPAIASADGTYQSTEAGQTAATTPPADRWLLNDGNASPTAADTAKTNPSTLTGNAVAWSQDPTEGEVLAFGDETGYAVTKTSAVNTAASFSVSAWVKLTSTRAYYTAVGQGGTNMGGFYLQYNKNLNAWAFVLPGSDSTSAPQFIAHDTKAPTLGAWTNLVGTFDATSRTVSLYVNGVLVGTATGATPWSATGPLTIGGVQLTGGAANNLFNGSISDVQVYSTALPASDAAVIKTPIRTFTGSAQAGTPGTFTLSTPSSNATEIVYGVDQAPSTSSPPASQIASNFTGGTAAVPAGRWKLADGTGTTATDTGGAHNATLSATGASWVQDASRNSQVLALNGSAGDAATAGPVITTNASYSVSAWVKLADTNNYYTALSQAGRNVGGFYLQYNKNLNAWAIVVPASDSTSASQFIVHASAAPTVNKWTNLAATVDGSNGTITLYINGVAAGTVTDTSLWNATGPLTIGAVTPTGAAAGNFFAGDIADVQVYGRALTATEVAGMYATVTVTLTPHAPGPHTLYAYAEDAAGDISGFSTNAYHFQAIGDPADTTTCISWSTCLGSRYGNAAAHTGTTSTGAGADGTNSISSADLQAAGWSPNGTITVDGATFALPNFGNGSDNILSANQTLSTPFGPGPLTQAGTTSLVFLATSTADTTPNPGGSGRCPSSASSSAPFVPSGTAEAGTYMFSGTNPAELCVPTGTISYSTGTPQTFALSVPDWLNGPQSLAAVTLPHLNTPTGQDSSKHPKIYAVSVPLKPGATAPVNITSITLPDVSSHADAGSQALHIFGMALRNTTTANAPSGQTWTAGWASPTEGNYNFNGAAINNQTYRIALKPTLSGDSVRIKLDNALGTSPLNIGSATIALAATPG